MVAACAADRAARERLRHDCLRRRCPGGAGAPGRRSGSVFDVCHAGVVLRALLFVHAAVGGGRRLRARSFAGWLALRRDRIERRLARRAALAAGGLRGSTGRSARCRSARNGARRSGSARSRRLGARWSTAMMSDAPVAGPSVWLASALAGAALAAALFQWLHLRAKATLPAETAARLAELQSRIRPHFLFNTLNTALALVRLDPARAEGVLEDLAELFRVALADSGERRHAGRRDRAGAALSGDRADPLRRAAAA